MITLPEWATEVAGPPLGPCPLCGTQTVSWDPDHCEAEAVCYGCGIEYQGSGWRAALALRRRTLRLEGAIKAYLEEYPCTHEWHPDDACEHCATLARALYQTDTTETPHDPT